MKKIYRHSFGISDCDFRSYFLKLLLSVASTWVRASRSHAASASGSSEARERLVGGNGEKHEADDKDLLEKTVAIPSWSRDLRFGRLWQ